MLRLKLRPLVPVPVPGLLGSCAPVNMIEPTEHTISIAWDRRTQDTLAALFPNATGVSAGTDVRVSGIKVGTVASQSLDPRTFQARLVLAIDERVRLPIDSSAVIASEGILGGSYVALTPGGDTEMLRQGDEIIDTQGSVDLMSLIGSFINKTGKAETAPSEGP